MFRKAYFRIVNGKPVLVRPGYVRKRKTMMQDLTTTPAPSPSQAPMSPTQYQEVAQLDGAYAHFRSLVNELLTKEESGESSDSVESAIAEGWENFTAATLKIFGLDVDEIDMEKVEDKVEEKAEMSAHEALRAEFEAMKQERAQGMRLLQLERRADKLLADKLLTPAEKASLFVDGGDNAVAQFSQFSQSQGLSLDEYLNRVEFCLQWREKNGFVNAVFFSETLDEPAVADDGSLLREYRTRNNYE